MPFCANCGSRLTTGAKFCVNCGATTGIQKEADSSTRKTVYEGAIHKCPNCGEVLNSFSTNCPSCGYEIRGASATSSVVQFYNDLNNVNSAEQQNYMIRNFPIPNAKEDIIEFMVLASSNILGESNRNLSEAWLAKFEQCYQKALLVFNNDNDLAYVQQIYGDCQAKIEKEKSKRITKFTIQTIVRNIAVVVGFIIMLIALGIDKTGGDASMYRAITGIILIVSSATLVKRNAVLMDYAVAAGSGLLAIGASFLFSDGSFVKFSGIVVLIIVAVNYFKSLVARK